MSVSSKLTIFVILVLLLLFLTFMMPVVAHAALFQDQLRMQPDPDVPSRIGGEALFLGNMG